MNLKVIAVSSVQENEENYALQPTWPLPLRVRVISSLSRLRYRNSVMTRGFPASDKIKLFDFLSGHEVNQILYPTDFQTGYHRIWTGAPNPVLLQSKNFTVMMD